MSVFLIFKNIDILAQVYLNEGSLEGVLLLLLFMLDSIGDHASPLRYFSLYKFSILNNILLCINKFNPVGLILK